MFNRDINYDSDLPESTEQYKQRWNSIRIVYLTMFFDSLSFSIVLASLWPYLQKVSTEPELNPTYVGWASVSFHVTGILVDFIMGYWTNKRGSMEPMLISLVFFGCGNFLYGYAQSCGSYGVFIIILSRGVIGLSTGVNVVARAALAHSTTLKERTTAMAHMSVLQGVGFAIGPAVQLLSIPLGDQGVYIDFLKLHFNLYTAPAFISMFIAAVNGFLIVAYYYEFRINIYKDDEEDTDIANFKALLKDESITDLRYDKIAILVLLLLYFIAQKAFALYETILPPLTMDMLAWTREETSLYASLLFLSAGIIAVFAFAISEVLEKVASDRFILVIGFVLIFFGFAIHLPWGNEHPDLKLSFPFINKTQNLSVTGLIESTAGHTGCPEEYKWCWSIPKLYIPQIIIGTIFLSIGYPFVMVFTSSLYSKVLGPSPQGLMQSWFGAVGGLARISAPVFITYLYVDLGPRWTFISVESLVVFAILIFICTYKKLIPYHLYVLSRNNNDNMLSKSINTNSNSGVFEPTQFHQTLNVPLCEKSLSDEQLNGTMKINTEVIMRNNAEVVLRSSVNLEEYCAVRQNRWSLIDQSASFYDGSCYSIESVNRL